MSFANRGLALHPHPRPIKVADANVAISTTMTISRLLTWSLVLRGGWLIQPSVFLRKTGSAIKFRNALQVKRHLWVSPRIRASLPELVDVITSAVACPNSRWHLVSEIGEWVVLKQNATKNSASVVALVTKEEEQEFESVKHVFSAAAFLDFIKSVDKGKSTLGSCYM